MDTCCQINTQLKCLKVVDNSVITVVAPVIATVCLNGSHSPQNVSVCSY